MERAPPISLQLLTPENALESLICLLEEQAEWETFAADLDALLVHMLKLRKEEEELWKLYDLRPLPKHEGPTEEAGVVQPNEGNFLPDEVMMKLLGRELLLTTSKERVLAFEGLLGDRELVSIKARIRQVGRAGCAAIGL